MEISVYKNPDQITVLVTCEARFPGAMLPENGLSWEIISEKKVTDGYREYYIFKSDQLKKSIFNPINHAYNKAKKLCHDLGNSPDVIEMKECKVRGKYGKGRNYQVKFEQEWDFSRKVMDAMTFSLLKTDQITLKRFEPDSTFMDPSIQKLYDRVDMMTRR